MTYLVKNVTSFLRMHFDEQLCESSHNLLYIIWTDTTEQSLITF